MHGNGVSVACSIALSDETDIYWFQTLWSLDKDSVPLGKANSDTNLRNSIERPALCRTPSARDVVGIVQNRKRKNRFSKPTKRLIDFELTNFVVYAKKSILEYNNYFCTKLHP